MATLFDPNSNGNGNGNGKGAATLPPDDATLMNKFQAMTSTVSAPSPGPSPVNAAPVHPEVSEELVEGPEESAEEPDDDKDEPIPDILASRTKQSAAKSPLLKIGLVGGVAGLIFLFAGFVMVTMTSGTGKVVTAESPSSTPSPSSGKLEGPSTVNSLNGSTTPGSDVGGHKATAALAEQEQELKLLNKQLKDAPKDPGKGQVTSPTAPPKPVASPAPVTTTAIAPQPQPQPSYRPAEVPSVAPAPIPVDPEKQLAAFTKAGSYGSVPATVVPTPTAMPAPMAPVTAPVPVRPVVAANPQPGGVSSTGQPSLISYMGGLPYKVDQAYGSMGITSGTKAQRKLLLGSASKATLMTDAVWAAEGKQPGFGGDAASPKFIVRADEPLKFTDGGVAIPEGALMVVTVRPLDSKTGLAEMVVESVIIDNTEYQPPAGALTIRGQGGGALIADRFDKGSQVASLDATLIFSSALSQIGSVMNQAQSSSSVSTNGTTTTTSTTPPPNYLGAAMQGGFGALTQTLSKRNEAAVADILKRPDVFFLGKGKSLQVFVNQSIAF